MYQQVKVHNLGIVELKPRNEDTRSTYPLPKSKVSADEGERHGHSEPKRQQSHESRERNGRGRALAPQHEVHYEEQGEHHAGTKLHVYVTEVLLDPTFIVVKYTYMVCCTMHLVLVNSSIGKILILAVIN